MSMALGLRGCAIPHALDFRTPSNLPQLQRALFFVVSQQHMFSIDVCSVLPIFYVHFEHVHLTRVIEAIYILSTLAIQRRITLRVRAASRIMLPLFIGFMVLGVWVQRIARWSPHHQRTCKTMTCARAPVGVAYPCNSALTRANMSTEASQL